MKNIWSSLVLAAVCATVISFPGKTSAADAPKQVIFAAGQPAMSIPTSVYSSVQQGSGLDLRFAGVSIKVQPTSGSTASLQAVSNGNGLYAWAGVIAFLELAQHDPSLVMVSFDPGNPYRIFVPPDGPIKTPADLKGKKIGLQSFGSGAYAMAVAIINAAGLDAKKDVTFIPVGVGALAADALRSGKIDAYAGVDATEPVIDTLLKQDQRAVESPINHMPGMNALVVTRKTLAEQPQLVAGLCKSFYAAPMFEKGNMTAAVLNHWAAYPSQRPSESDEKTALAEGVKQLKARLDNLAMPGEDGLYGYVSIKTMQGVVDKLHQLGAMAQDPDIQKFTDLSMAKECGAFDGQALANEARSWIPKGLLPNEFALLKASTAEH